MAWTMTDLEALERAIADGRGARTISFGDQTVSFNSLSEMRELRGQMKRELAGSETQTRYAGYSKGLTN